ncbi:MAG TPA: hypothetical protein VEA36_02320 [Candidatus Paceibacterota bacterium]|nr:hypothetical protein [Candidatus Paceibacterota bacterium]
MDIEDLNKTQLLLLTLLVNFVTSIATGVLTVSLLDETSPTVTQTVNRIVERTVESVTEAPATIPAIIPPKEVAAAPSDEERRTAAIAAAAARSVEIYKNASGKVFVSRGTYLPKSKAVVTAETVFLPSEVAILFPDGTMVEASKSKSGGGLAIYGFADTAVLPPAPGSNLVATADIKSGQTAIGLAADRSAVTGMVTKVEAAGISASVPGIPAGASIVNLAGNVIGISQGTGVFIPAAAVNELLSAPTAGADDERAAS